MAISLKLFLQGSPQHIKLYIIYDAVAVEVYSLEALSYSGQDCFLVNLVLLFPDVNALKILIQFRQEPVMDNLC